MSKQGVAYLCQVVNYVLFHEKPYMARGDLFPMATNTHNKPWSNIQKLENKILLFSLVQI